MVLFENSMSSFTAIQFSAVIRAITNIFGSSLFDFNDPNNNMVSRQLISNRFLTKILNSCVLYCIVFSRLFFPIWGIAQVIRKVSGCFWCRLRGCWSGDSEHHRQHSWCDSVLWWRWRRSSERIDSIPSRVSRTKRPVSLNVNVALEKYMMHNLLHCFPIGYWTASMP